MLNLLKYCRLCRIPSRKILCLHCYYELETTTNHHSCKICKKIIYTQEDICFNCSLTPPYFDNIYCKYIYAKPLSSILYQLKFKRNKKYANLLGYLLYQTLIEIPNLLDFDLILPVPISKERWRTRGFNQTELLLKYAKLVNKHLKINCSYLKRHKNSIPQTLKSGLERQQNLADAFIINKNVQNLSILLIDDVITTGSTLNNIAYLLKEHGANKVCACTLMRTC